MALRSRREESQTTTATVTSTARNRGDSQVAVNSVPPPGLEHSNHTAEICEPGGTCATFVATDDTRHNDIQKDSLATSDPEFDLVVRLWTSLPPSIRAEIARLASEAIPNNVYQARVCDPGYP